MRKVTQIASFENINLLNDWLRINNNYEYVDFKVDNGIMFLIVKIEIDG